jgi:hypothetical protein
VADPRSGSTDHAGHDLLLVAEAADRGNVLPAGLIDCPDCRALHNDLRALAAATPESALPARPRDLRLSAADAARLRRPAWRRWLADIGTSRDAVTRPLAYGLTTLGLAGLLISAGPNLLFGTAGTVGGAGTAGTAGDAAGQGAGQFETPGVQEAPAGPSEGGVDTTGDGLVERVQGGITSAPAAIPDAPAVGEAADPGQSPGNGLSAVEASDIDALSIRDDASGVSVLLVLAGTLIIAGVGIFGLRWTARRFEDH